MKVFLNSMLSERMGSNFAFNRIMAALRKYAPSRIEIVDREDDADLEVLFAHMNRKVVQWLGVRLNKKGKKYAVIQIQLRSTPNAKTWDWVEAWKNAELIWSYYDLPKFCLDDGILWPGKNFYYAPLGVDPDVFKETNSIKNYIVATCAKGLSRECLGQLLTAAKTTDNVIFHFGKDLDIDPITIYNQDNLTDEQLAFYYSQCHYV